jgi:hypothetical protein
MIFFEKNKVLGVEPKRVLNILRVSKYKKPREIINLKKGQHSRKSLENGLYHSLYTQIKNFQFSLQIVPLV